MRNSEKNRALFTGMGCRRKTTSPNTDALRVLHKRSLAKRSMPGYAQQMTA